MPAGSTAAAAEKLTGKLKCPSAGFANAGPFRTFIAYLKNPLGWEKTAACVAFAMLHGQGRQITSERAEELLLLMSSSQAPSKAEAFKELLSADIQPGGDNVATLACFGAGNEGQLLLMAQKSDMAALATRPASVRGVLRLSDKREQRQTEEFKESWRAWMRAQVFLQFLLGMQLVSDELIDPPEIDRVGDSAAPAIRPVARLTPFPRAYVSAANVQFAADIHSGAKPLSRRSPVRPAFEKILENLDEAIHPALRAAELRGFGEFAAPYELFGDNGVEGEIEVAWPEQQVGLYLEQQSDIAKRLEREGWRLLAIEARPSAAQLLELLEAP